VIIAKAKELLLSNNDADAEGIHKISHNYLNCGSYFQMVTTGLVTGIISLQQDAANQKKKKRVVTQESRAKKKVTLFPLMKFVVLLFTNERNGCTYAV
jgi:hypothetical protein